MVHGSIYNILKVNQCTRMIRFVYRIGFIAINILIIQYYCYWISEEYLDLRSACASARSRRPPARSAAGERDADSLVRRNRLIGAGHPGRRRGVFGGLHVERRELPAEDSNHLDRHRDRPAEPAEPLAIRYDQLDLALRVAHHLGHAAERRI